MIRKKFFKKLSLKKSTISNLNHSQMTMVKGGDVKPMPASVSGGCYTCTGPECIKVEEL